MADDLIAVRMPDFGPKMEFGVVLEWLVEEGADVEAGDDLAEIEADKVDTVLAAPATGVLLRKVAELDAEIPTDGLIAVIGPAGAGADAVQTFIEGERAPR